MPRWPWSPPRRCAGPACLSVSLDITLPTHGAGPAGRRRGGAGTAPAPGPGARPQGCRRRRPRWPSRPAAPPCPVLLAAAGPADGALAALPGSTCRRPRGPSPTMPPRSSPLGGEASCDHPRPGRVPRLPLSCRCRLHPLWPGRTGELGRGGRYVSANDEPATGMSLLPRCGAARRAPAAAAQRASSPPAPPAGCGAGAAGAGFRDRRRARGPRRTGPRYAARMSCGMAPPFLSARKLEWPMSR